MTIFHYFEMLRGLKSIIKVKYSVFSKPPVYASKHATAALNNFSNSLYLDHVETTSELLLRCNCSVKRERIAKYLSPKRRKSDEKRPFLYFPFYVSEFVGESYSLISPTIHRKSPEFHFLYIKISYSIFIYELKMSVYRK